MYRPALPRAMVSDDMFPWQTFVVNIPSAIDQYALGHVCFLHGTVVVLDHSACTVSVRTAIGDDRNIHYHNFVVDTGGNNSVLVARSTSGRGTFARMLGRIPCRISSCGTILVAGGDPVGVVTACELRKYFHRRAS